MAFELKDMHNKFADFSSQSHLYITSLMDI